MSIFSDHPDAAVVTDGLGKSFRRDGRPHVTLREGLAALLRPRRQGSTIWAFRELSFHLPRGEILGLVGANGAGKSTLLRVLGRVTPPSAGVARVAGRVAAVSDVGAGFHRELTARENLLLAGALYGMSRAEVRQQLDAMVAFAECAALLETPLKRLSSGTVMRLALAVALHSRPDLLLADEVFHHADLAFQRRCLAQVRALAAGGCGVLLVSHQLAVIEQLCQRVLVLEGGRELFCGATAPALASYRRRVSGREAAASSGPEI